MTIKNMRGADAGPWKEMLAKAFPTLAKEPRLLTVFAEIGVVLENKGELLNRGLAALESELKNAYKAGGPIPSIERLAQGKGVQQQFKQAFATKTKGIEGEAKVSEFESLYKQFDSKPTVFKQKFNGILSELLKKEEEKHGFSPVVPTLGGIFTPDLFAKVIKQGLHFKDPGVSPLHGDYSHRLQWWLLFQYIDLNDGGGAKLTWPEVFKALPEHKGKPKSGEFDLWAFMFDYLNTSMNPGSRKSDTWSRPEDLNEDIMQSGPPLLKAILTARYNKRLLMSGCFGPKDKLWSELYPAMKKKANFTEFHKDVSDTENVHIALALVPPTNA